MIRAGRHILASVVVSIIFAGMGLAKATGFPDGKALYEKNCAVCHGKNGNVPEYGKHLKPFPARNLRAVAQWLDTDEFRRIITYGLHNSKMTAKEYTLDPLEIKAVTQYIKTFKFSPDINKGRKLYMQVCAVCHGKDGRARTGLGPKKLVYSKMDMKDLIYTIRWGRPGTMMMPKRHQLSNTDTVNIAAYVYNLRYKPDGQRGAILFRKNCTFCHATPDRIHLTANPSFQPVIHDLDANQLELLIRYGQHVDLAGKRVYRLTGDNIQDITAYIREWVSKK